MIRSELRQYFKDKFTYEKWTGRYEYVVGTEYFEEQIESCVKRVEVLGVEYVNIGIYNFEKVIHKRYYKELYDELMPVVWKRIHKTYFFTRIYLMS